MAIAPQDSWTRLWVSNGKTAQDVSRVPKKCWRFLPSTNWGGTKHSSVLGHHLRETSERLWKLMNWITKSPFTDKAAPWDQIPATGIWKFRSICEICVCVCETFHKLVSERLGVSSYQHKSWKTTPMCPENMDFPSEIELFSITDFRVPRREKKKKQLWPRGDGLTNTMSTGHSGCS